MQRRPNTDISGRPFTDEVIEAVWQKARAMGTSAILRVDAWGWTIVKQDFGNVRSRYGWEIDHILPVAQGGDDELTNLQPLQWENNRRKDEIQGMAASGKAHHAQNSRPSPPASQPAPKKRH